MAYEIKWHMKNAFTLGGFFFFCLTPTYNLKWTKDLVHMFSHRILGNTLQITSSLNPYWRGWETELTILSDLLSNRDSSSIHTT